MNYNDGNHIYLIFCSFFCSRDPIKVKYIQLVLLSTVNKGNKKITELRTILQRESQNS